MRDDVAAGCRARTSGQQSRQASASQDMLPSAMDAVSPYRAAYRLPALLPERRRLPLK